MGKWNGVFRYNADKGCGRFFAVFPLAEKDKKKTQPVLLTGILPLFSYQLSLGFSCLVHVAVYVVYFFPLLSCCSSGLVCLARLATDSQR